MAKRRLPRVLFEAIESRVEDDRGRYLVVLSKHDQSVRLFDEVVSSPFGISPTGIAGVRMSAVRPNRAASPAGMRKPPHLRSDHLRRERPRSAIRASIVALIAIRNLFFFGDVSEIMRPMAFAVFTSASGRCERKRRLPRGCRRLMHRNKRRA